MNVELYMAKRFHFSENAQKNRMSRPAIRIATIGIAVGLAVMIVAVAVVISLKTKYVTKWSDLAHTYKYQPIPTLRHDTPPIAPSDSLLAKSLPCPMLHTYKKQLQTGILKTSSDFQGIVLKGVDKDFDWTFFKKT